MTIYPQFHKMEAPVNVSLASYPGHQFLESPSLRADSPPQSKWSEKMIDKNGMSITFRDVFRNFKENTKSADLIKVRSRPQSKYDRIADAFSRTEHLLLSGDNVRPPSRTKTHSDANEDSNRGTSAGQLSHTSDKQNRKTPEKKEESHVERKTHSPAHTENDTNNAAEQEANVTNLNLVLSKKGKKHRKRIKSDSKNKKVKPGRLSVPTSVIHHDSNKRLSAPVITNKSSVSTTKSGVSSDTINSKPIQSSAVSYTVQGLSSENATNKQIHFTCNHRSASDVVSSNVGSKTASGNGDKTSVPSTHYTHGSVNEYSHNFKDPIDAMQIEIQPLTAQKVELNKRILSGKSIKSAGSYFSSSQPDTQSSPVTINQFTLTAKPCNLPQMNTENVSVVMQGTSVKQKTVNSSKEFVSKESTLASIYGPQNNIPQRAFSNAEDFRKVKKIFLSEKQSGTLKENGMEFPCAPPATPIPDVMKRYEYVPCMNDIRSQRAVKTKLQVMEREAQRKKEKQKEATVKLERQQVKEREKMLKIKQRREIYALNKIMTELEHKRFLEFCSSKGLNT